MKNRRDALKLMLGGSAAGAILLSSKLANASNSDSWARKGDIILLGTTDAYELDGVVVFDLPEDNKIGSTKTTFRISNNRYFNYKFFKVESENPRNWSFSPWYGSRPWHYLSIARLTNEDQASVLLLSPPYGKDDFQSFNLSSVMRRNVERSRRCNVYSPRVWRTDNNFKGDMDELVDKPEFFKPTLSLSDEVWEFDNYSECRYRGSLKKLRVALKPVPTITVDIESSQKDLKRYESMLPDGFFPADIEGVSFLSLEDAGRLVENGKIKRMGTKDLGLVGRIVQNRSPTADVFNASSSIWIDQSKRVVVGKSVDFAKEIGAKFVRVIGAEESDHKTSWPSLIHFSDRNQIRDSSLERFFTALNSDQHGYSFSGACELYR